MYNLNLSLQNINASLDRLSNIKASRNSNHNVKRNVSKGKQVRQIEEIYNKINKYNDS